MKNFFFKTALFAGSFFALSSLKAQVPTLLRLQVSGSSMQNETVVYFDTAGSSNYEPLHDAPSLGVSPGQVHIVSVFDSIDFQVKCLPALTQDISIPLKITTGTGGTYFIEGVETQNLPSGACLILHDNFTNTDIDLRAGGYSCFISDTESVSRFELDIHISLLPVAALSVLYPTCTNSGNGRIVASGIGSGPWNYYWKDSMNNVIKTSLNTSGPDTFFYANAGTYKVDINTPGDCDNGNLEFILKGSEVPEAFFTSDTIAPLYADVNFTNASVRADSYWWDFGDGGGSADTDAVYSYAASGIYTVSLSAYNNLCNETAVYTRQLVISGSLNTEQKKAGEENMILGCDKEGLYVQFGYKNRNISAQINVFDMSGRSHAEELKIYDVAGKKVYIPGNNSSGIQVIHVLTSAGDVQTGKFVLEK